jgi:hypothetical protein
MGTSVASSYIKHTSKEKAYSTVKLWHRSYSTYTLFETIYVFYTQLSELNEDTEGP